MKIRFIISIYIILGTIMVRCFNPDDYDSGKSSTQVKLSPTDTAVVADGVSSAKIEFRVVSNRPTALYPITFKTTAGSFIGGQGDSIVISPEKNFIAYASLVNTKAETATVIVKMPSVTFSSTSKVEFTKAYPDKIFVSVDSFAIKSSFNSEIMITANISTATGGVASSGTTVNFNAYDNNNNPIGYFLNMRNNSISDIKGKATIRFSAGQTAYRGLLRIIANTTKENGDIISDTTFINITD
jgi:hypothetical protein